MADLRHVHAATVAEDERERVPTTEGGDGFTSRKTGRTIHHDLALWIDADALLKGLAWKAARSKGGKATMARGAIVVKRTATRYTTN